MSSFVPLCLISLLSTACTTDALLSEDIAALDDHAPILIQPGTGQMLLAVTEDHYAVYQEGQSLFATELVPGAERVTIGEVPGTNIAQVLQVGKVVFLWTNPQRALPGFGVSPLVMFTGEGGAHLISAQSSVGLVAAAASADSRQIVFPTNATADNARGDIVHAYTDDPLNQTTLLANTAMTFPNGLCRPLVNFGRDDGGEVPVATYCAGTDTTATMSKWVDGVKTDLISNIATPLQFILDSDLEARTFLVNLASNSVATVTMDGAITIVDPAARSFQGFIGRGGAVGYQVATAPQQLRLALDGDEPEVVSTLSLIFRGTYNRSGYSKPRTVSSDGSLALFASKRSPTTGLRDMNLLDLTTGDIIPLETETNATVFSEIWTSDGDHALYFKELDPATGLATLVAGDRTGDKHTLGPASGVWDALAAFGDDVTFNANPIVDGSSLRAFLLSTGDLYAIDANHPHATPREISAQASLGYLPSHDRKKVVFPTATQPAGSGLYLAGARP
ncbi:MAG TPA: hypothetical protein VIU61_17270 [Kofleriaceae bacterium]